MSGPSLQDVDQWKVFGRNLSGQTVHDNIAARARGVAAKVESEPLKQDLEAFARSLELAYEKKDVRLLILAHRIIHDLDYWVFSNETFESRDYWGATSTLEGKEGSPVGRLLDGWSDYRQRILSDGSVVGG